MRNLLYELKKKFAKQNIEEDWDFVNRFSKKLADYKKDEYTKSYTAFTIGIHEQLDCPKFALPDTLLVKPFYSIQTFETENECMETARKILEDTYNYASHYFVLGHYQCIAMLTASYYSKEVANCLEPLIDKLSILAHQNRQWTTRDKINLYYNNVYEHFLKRFEILLQEKEYAWQSFFYYSSKIINAKYDYYNERKLFNAYSEPELPDFTERIYIVLDKIIQDMERHLYETLFIFCEAADNEYRSYIEALEMAIDKVVSTQMPYRLGEELPGYLKRMCILNEKFNTTVG